MNNRPISTHKGFTIIEVMIFLAISGALLVGVIVGTSATIARQRYNDAVESFAEFMRRQYSVVISPQISSHSFSSSCGDTDGLPMLVTRANGDQYFNKQWLLSLFDGDTFVGTSGGAHNTSRGRSNCALYGIMINFIDDGRTAVRTPLIGTDFAIIRDWYESESVAGRPIETLATADFLPGGGGIEVPIPEPRPPLDFLVLSMAGINAGQPKVQFIDRDTGQTANISRTAIENSGDNFSQYSFFNNTKCTVGFSSPPNSEIFDFRYRAAAEVVAANGGMFNSTIFIIRSPINGTVKTYLADNFNMDMAFKIGGVDFTGIDDFNRHGGTLNLATGGNSPWNSNGSCPGQPNQELLNQMETIKGNLSISRRFLTANFIEGQINICIKTDDNFAYADKRRMIKVAANGRNPTAVAIIDQDGGGNLCEVATP